jgi:hypothetical protein
MRCALELRRQGYDGRVRTVSAKASGWGPHAQGRSVMQFYTESVTVYRDAWLRR